MQNITEILRKTNITVSLHEKNNIYQAVINYKDGTNKRKQKWVSTGIKAVRGNKRIAIKKAEELREKFEKSFNLQNRIKQENDEKLLNYKNPLLLGKYTKLNNPDKNKITFDIAKNNYEHNSSNYTNPTFYTDCSNPITLGFINRNIIQNYSVSDNKTTIAYNAKVLKDSNINLEELNSTLDFTIHIKNNLGHKFSCKMHIDIKLDEEFINNGYSYLSIPFSNGEYKFSRD